MYLCYVDESGDTGPGSSKHLLLGATALFEGRWGWVQDTLRRMIGGYFPPGQQPREIHCAEIRGGKGDYRGLSKATRTQILDDVCELVRSNLDSELRLFTVIIDKAYWYARNPGKTGHDLYGYAFEELVNRFDLYLRRSYANGRPTKGMMIVDPHASALSAALRSSLGRFQTTGTRWSRVHHVIETVLFLHSHESPGLQLADLCAFATWRLVEFGDDSLISQISSGFDREPRSSAVTPGKWHGIKYIGDDGVVRGSIQRVWPSARIVGSLRPQARVAPGALPEQPPR